MAWLSLRSIKKKDTHDIRDFIAVHGKIMRTSSPVECSDGGSTSKHTKTKQMTLALVHCHGHKRAREKEAPATRFSTGVRKKAAVVDVVEQDCQERPFTDNAKENVAPYRRKRPGNTNRPSLKARKSQTAAGCSRSLVEHPQKQSITSPTSLPVKKRLCSSNATSSGQSAIDKRSKLVAQWHRPPASHRLPKTRQKYSERVSLKTDPKTIIAECDSNPTCRTSQPYRDQRDAPPLLPLREDRDITVTSSHPATATATADTNSMEYTSTASLELVDGSAASPDDVDLPLASTYIENSENFSCPLKGFRSSIILPSDDHCNTDDLLAELSMYEKIL